MKLTKKQWIRLGVRALVMAVAALLILHFAQPDKKKKDTGNSAVFMFSSLNTMVSVHLCHPDPQYDFEPAFKAVKEEFAKTEAICKISDSESELSRLNRTAGRQAFHCSDDLWQLLAASKMYYQKTNGAFDVSVLPSREGVQDASKKAGMDKIEISDSAHTIRFSVPGMSLNLDCIAKGWTLDRTARMLQDRFGIRKGFLSAGGNMLVFGGEFTGSIQDPFDARRTCGKVKLSGAKALATHGREYSYIPDEGHPAEALFSATVIADSGLESDVLAMSFYLSGMDLQRQFPRIPVLLIGHREDDPSLVRVQQSGDCWELDVPLRVPQKYSAGTADQPNKVDNILREKKESGKTPDAPSADQQNHHQ